MHACKPTPSQTQSTATIIVTQPHSYSHTENDCNVFTEIEKRTGVAIAQEVRRAKSAADVGTVGMGGGLMRMDYCATMIHAWPKISVGLRTTLEILWPR